MVIKFDSRWYFPGVSLKFWQLESASFIVWPASVFDRVKKLCCLKMVKPTVEPFLLFIKRRFSRHIPLGRDSRAEPELAGRIIYLLWPGNTLGFPRSSWIMSLGRGLSGFVSWTFLFDSLKGICYISIIRLTTLSP